MWLPLLRGSSEACCVSLALEAGASNQDAGIDRARKAGEIRCIAASSKQGNLAHAGSDAWPEEAHASMCPFTRIPCKVWAGGWFRSLLCEAFGLQLVVSTGITGTLTPKK